MNSLNSLRHYSVVCRDDQHGYIGRHSSSRSHCCESGMTGSVEESYLLSVGDNFVSADMLSNSARLGCRDLSMSYSVENRRFAVIDVSHYAYYRASRFEIFLLVLGSIYYFILDSHDYFLLGLRAEFGCDNRRGIIVDIFVYSGHYAVAHKLFDYLGCRNFKPCRKIPDSDFLGNFDLEMLFLPLVLYSL